MKKRIITVALTLVLVFCFVTTAYATMQLFIKQQTGKTLTVEIEAYDSIRALKDKIALQTNVHPDRMRLIYGGKELVDTSTVADYNIQKEDNVQLVYKLRGNDHPQDGHTGWTAWNDATSLPTMAGDYYLTCDVTLSETWKVPAVGGTYLCLNGHVINANGGDFSAITIGERAMLTLFDCDTTTQHAGYVDADGLWHLGTGTGTAMTITGGVITGGYTSGTGGGVNNSGTFTMNGGTIAGNKSSADNNCGGGVYNAEGSSFTLSGGTIIGNWAKNNGGGVFLKENATMTMTDGAIVANHANKNGGGLYTYDGTIEMSGGAISGNSASSDGGGVYANGTFTMTDGEIAGNSASNDGGGVFTNAESTFTMQGGAVSGNSAKRGGGVFVNSLGTFNMTAGEICNNAANGAGGIRNSTNAVMTLKADTDKTIEITGNGAESWEGGIANWGEMHLSGQVIIKNNICKASEYPINLATDQAIIIDGALTGSDIYITHAIRSTDIQDAGVLTSGYSTKSGGTGLNDFFHYDGPDSFAMILNSSNELEVANACAITNGAKADDEETNHGYLTIDKTMAVEGETVTVTVTPSTGYILTAGSLKIELPEKCPVCDEVMTSAKCEKCGAEIPELVLSKDDIYTLTMPGYPVTVTAEFEEEPSDWQKLQNALNGTITASVPDLFEINGNTIKLLADFNAVTGDTTLTVAGTRTLDLNGHVINGKITNTTYVGSVITVPADANLTLTDSGSNGKITGGKATYGGGLNVSGTFNMTGGILEGNTATYGAAISVSGTATMSGNSQITGNKSNNFGGGVYVQGTFTMTGDSAITNNKASTGAGVYVYAGSKFVMNGGSIDHNTASSNGGGVYDNGNIVLGGAAKITDNVWLYSGTSTVQNLHMASGKTLTLGSGDNGNGTPVPTTDMSVGITLMKNHNGVFTEANDTDYSDRFTADLAPDYKVINLASNSNKLKLVTKYDVTVDSGITNGVVITDATDSKAYEGDTVALTVTPDNGYQLKTLTVAPTAGGDPITATPDAQDETKYTFIMPNFAVTVTAEFEEAPHVHNLVKVDGQPATTTAAGFKDYYECKDSADACGALFEDEDGTIPIDDLATWKAVGGNGYIAPLPAPVLTGISVTTAPGKTTYTEGETFDPTGMVVTATYSDGSTKTVTGYTVSPDGALAVTDTAVEISYTENGETKTANVTIKVDPVPPVDYKIIEGANQMIYENADSAVFRSNADFDKFLYVEVDGKKLGKEDYVCYEGSTVVILKASFIKTLGVGDHTLRIVSNDGSATTKFTIKPLPPTGDNTPVALLTLALLAALGTIAFVMKKQGNHNC